MRLFSVELFETTFVFDDEAAPDLPSANIFHQCYRWTNILHYL